MRRGVTHLLGLVRQAAAEAHCKRTFSSKARPTETSETPAKGSRHQLWWQAAIAAGVTGGLAWKWYSSQGRTPQENCVLCRIALDGKELPEFDREEVARHRSREAGGRVWVTYRNGVYDITDFLDYHPAGEGQIMQAAGDPIDPFWEQYPRHLSGQAVRVLADYQVGRLKAEGPASQDGVVPAPAALPAHLSGVDEGAFRLRVEGSHTAELSLDELRQKFPKCSITASLKCSPAKASSGASTNEGGSASKSSSSGSSNSSSLSVWSGAPLRDVLRAAGVREGDPRLSTVQFVSLDGGRNPTLDTSQPGSAGNEALLAYEVDGQPLTPGQGGPLRLVVPGAGGRRNVKWVSGISFGGEQGGAGVTGAERLQQKYGVQPTPGSADCACEKHE